MGNFLEQYHKVNRFLEAFGAATDDLLQFSNVGAVRRFLSHMDSPPVSGIEAALRIKTPIGLDDITPAGVPRGKLP